MAYVVLDLKSYTVLHEAETKGLCNQWVLQNFAKSGKRPSSQSIFVSPYTLLVTKKDNALNIKPKSTYRAYNYGILEYKGTPEDIADKLGVRLEDVMRGIKERQRIRKGPLEGWRFERDVVKSSPSKKRQAKHKGKLFTKYDN